MTQGDISRTVLLTGPTSGIGAHMLRALVRHPSRPRLVLLGRDSDRLADAVAVARSAGLEAHPVVADLADLASIAQANDRLRHLAEESGLDAVILNAGAQFTDSRRRSAQGWELTFAVNVIAQHLLLQGTERLLAPGGHVVLLGSSTHRGRRASLGLVPDPQWRAPGELAQADAPATGSEDARAERHRGGVAYASSKLALVTLSHPWAERLAANGRRLNTYDPGIVAGTGLGRDMPGYMYWVWKHLMPAMSVLPGASTAPRSARHAVELALGDAHAGLAGGYFEIGRVATAEAVTRDAGRQHDLMTWLDAQTRQFAPASRAF